LINVAGELRVRITIVEDVAVETNIARIVLLASTKRKDPNQSGEARSEGPYLKEFNLPTSPLTPGRRSRHRSKSRRSTIGDDVIYIDIEAKKRWLPNSI
jgi:hypothetical protein